MKKEDIHMPLDKEIRRLHDEAITLMEMEYTAPGDAALMAHKVRPVDKEIEAIKNEAYKHEAEADRLYSKASGLEWANDPKRISLVRLQEEGNVFVVKANELLELASTLKAAIDETRARRMSCDEAASCRYYETWAEGLKHCAKALQEKALGIVRPAFDPICYDADVPF